MGGQKGRERERERKMKNCDTSKECKEWEKTDIAGCCTIYRKNVGGVGGITKTLPLFS